MIFDDVWASRQGDLDRGFGEGFTVSVPAAAPAAADPDDPQKRQPRQAAASFTGIWTEASGSFRAHNPESHAEIATRRIGANRVTIDFRTDAVPFRILQGCVVTRLVDGSRYQVAEVTPDDVGRTALTLTGKTVS